MPQAVWTGDFSFGLVNIPVKLYAATNPKRVRFHQYEAGTGRRIRYRRVAEGPAPSDRRRRYDLEDPPPLPEAWAQPAPGPAPVPDRAEETESDRPIHQAATEPPTETPEELPEDRPEEAEVPWEEIVKGYEVEPGRVVTVDPEELEAVAPEPSRVLEVEQFVDLESIDPVHFEKSYYVVPQRGGATERPYWLLYRAMEEAGKVAIGRLVLRTKEYLVAVRPTEHVLMLQTLFYADEVRDPKEVLYPSGEEPSERELQLALQFLEALEGEWQPARHRDEHRERLLDLLHSRAGEATVIPELEEEAPISPATDLMQALQASVEAARRAREQEDRQTG
jgi:DNA end-binding protein Ku